MVPFQVDQRLPVVFSFGSDDVRVFCARHGCPGQIGRVPGCTCAALECVQLAAAFSKASLLAVKSRDDEVTQPSFRPVPFPVIASGCWFRGRIRTPRAQLWSAGSSLPLSSGELARRNRTMK